MLSVSFSCSYLRGGGGKPHDAEAESIDCQASDLSAYDALICYFHREIDETALKAVLPSQNPEPAVAAVIGNTVTLTSNIGQAAGATTHSSTNRDYVQGFRTGTLSGNKVWRVDSVTVFLTFNVPTPAMLPTLRVHLFNATSGVPVGFTPLSTLTIPTGQTLKAGRNKFTTSDPIALNPGTWYVALIDVTNPSSPTGNRGSDVRVTYTSSTDEDVNVSGWSIRSTAYNRAWGATSNSFGNPHNGQPIKIAIGGHEYTPEVPAPTPPPPFTQTHGELGPTFGGDRITQSTTCGGKPHPVHEAFRRDPLGTDWSYADSVFCNESTGQWVTGRPYQAGVDYARDDQLEPPSEANGCLYDKPSYQAQTDADGNLLKNADGTYVYKRYIGAYWDPLAGVCKGMVEG